jgi:hypothetical protein
VKNGISDINVVVIFQKIGNRKISNDDVKKIVKKNRMKNGEP